jgi:hypothetical protein
MGSDSNPPRSPGRLPHSDGLVIANIDGQEWHSQLTSVLRFLAMASTVNVIKLEDAKVFIEQHGD